MSTMRERSDIRKAANIIITSFEWRLTSQGADYWEGVWRALSLLGQEKDEA